MSKLGKNRAVNCCKRKRCCRDCQDGFQINHKIENTDQLLKLLSIYNDEWKQRDNIMWKQNFTFFFASFVVSILPYTKIWDIDFSGQIPKWAFPICGALIAGMFLYISTQYAKRLSAIGNSYRRLIKMLPEEYRREEIYSSNNINNHKRLAFVVPRIMFTALVLFSVFIFYLTIKK